MLMICIKPVSYSVIPTKVFSKKHLAENWYILSLLVSIVYEARTTAMLWIHFSCNKIGFWYLLKHVTTCTISLNSVILSLSQLIFTHIRSKLITASGLNTIKLTDSKTTRSATQVRKRRVQSTMPQTRIKWLPLWVRAKDG